MPAEEEENAAELEIEDEFLKAKCLMNCEVALILEHKYEQLQQMADDPMNQVSQVFEKSLQYVQRFSRYKNPDAVRQVREILSGCELAEFERLWRKRLRWYPLSRYLSFHPDTRIMKIIEIAALFTAKRSRS